MKERGNSILRRALGFVGAVSAAVCLLALILDAMGTSAPLMLSLMKQHAPAEATGLADAAYEDCAVMIAGYLGGSVEAFQLTASVNGAEAADVFNADEQAHMADCRELFTLCRTVVVITLALTLGCIAALYFLRRADHAGLKGFRWGLHVTLLLIAALIVWALADFDGLFVLFHRLSFRNDLWLMDPAKDMIIRLMPLDFFTHYAALIGGTWVGLLAAMELVTGLPLRKRKQA